MAPLSRRPLFQPRLLRQPLQPAAQQPLQADPLQPIQPPSRRLPWGVLGAGAAVCGLLLGGCQLLPGGGAPSAQDRQLLQRQEQLELKLQQLEQKLNNLNVQNGADNAGKPPAGPVKSLTLRTGTEDDRLRIYWADGTSSDLPCTKEQATLVCG